MKELITVASAFIIVVGLALFMYTGNQKHTNAVISNQELKEIVEKNYEEHKAELEAIKLHLNETDSIFHKRNVE
jgi:hypothetical protein